MPRLRKALFHNHIYFITCSVESGIMLPANPLVSFLIKSALIRAQEHHPIKISHLIVNGTHMHMIVRVINPEDICGFMERFKTESAHYLNRLLGRKKRTIWCSGYDSPCLIELDRVIEKIVYLYTNPVKDGLIDSINHYPGISSWQIFKSNRNRLKASMITRDLVSAVNQNQDFSAYERSKKLIAKYCEKPKLIKIETDDWMKAFGQIDSREINQEIIRLIEERENEISKEREGRSFMGAFKLINQGIDLTYQPVRSGRKMWCICRDVNLRKRFIGWIKDLVATAREAYKEWKIGDTKIRMPAGMFAPRMPVLENLVFLD